jgi:mRNA-degrading endonuclease RelE of RelBE toxin-antitoxin system
MISHTTERFWEAYRELPSDVRKQARKAYQLFLQNPHHPSLQFKRVHPSQPIYSARVSREYRALAVRDEDVLVWFWIGSHSGYDKLISTL